MKLTHYRILPLIVVILLVCIIGCGDGNENSLYSDVITEEALEQVSESEDESLVNFQCTIAEVDKVTSHREPNHEIDPYGQCTVGFVD